MRSNSLEMQLRMTGDRRRTPKKALGRSSSYSSKIVVWFLEDESLILLPYHHYY